ncbi:hypothetical protein [Propionivibrio sp.]|uniref:hypothetical protein n=1 Tax=Propionivibrio sp. TaxID=2212460 RepID=UPI003BEFBD80
MRSFPADKIAPSPNRWRRMKSHLYNIVFCSDLLAIRFTLALGALFIGLGMAWPAAIFPTVAQIEAGEGRNTYALMAQIAPEWLWSLCFTVQGSVMALSLITDYRSKWLLWVDAAFGVIIWTVSVSACYLAYWRGFDRIMEYRPPAIMGGEVAAALASWWVFVRYHFGSQAEQNRCGKCRRFTDRMP